MSWLRYFVVNVVETLFRMFPFPCRTGVIQIGHPGRDTPVFLTCNYHLTVERVKRALKGLDCYLLVANSRGINVWCAATGGLFTHHDVISALKTSGIEERVDHRQVILPQLAATGIEARMVQEKTGWKAIWGPVYAKDIPAFLENQRRTPAVRRVTFNWRQRAEMAAAWGALISIVTALALLPFWPAALWPAVLLTWAIALTAFVAFPLYARWLGPRPPGTRRLAFEHGGLQLVLWGLCLAGLVTYAALAGTLSWAWLWRWSLLALVLVVLVSVDLTGSTPVYKSGLHADRLFKVTLDTDRCKGAGFCEQVCPRACFEVDREGQAASMPGAARCVQCGACIVQCPLDALSFCGPNGEHIPPQTIRRFKLNLMGQRSRETY
jgi:NAD-dependent dihydropyrimidine dehydrogenase PreA subunit